ncbi:MAG: hypothetical protein NTY53_03970 [Kiritimatiellaeota bacterium]|nr:hypothetical protein [Kiritimatiellota bacterium]
MSGRIIDRHRGIRDRGTLLNVKIISAGLAAGISLAVSGCCSAPKEIYVQEFFEANVIGLLGVPLGHAVEVEAVVVTAKSEMWPKAYTSSYLLKVMRVAGRSFAKPSLFLFSDYSHGCVKLSTEPFRLNKNKKGRKISGHTEYPPAHRSPDDDSIQTMGFGYFPHLEIVKDLP